MSDIVLYEKRRVLRDSATREKELPRQDCREVVLVVELHETREIVGLATHDVIYEVN